MTAADSAERFAAALFAERTRMLADRGRVVPVPSIRRERRLLCEDGGALLAVAPEAIRAIRECRFEPVAMLRPAALGIMLGMILFEGRLVSVLSAARLLGTGRVETPEPGGAMLMLHPALAGTALPAPVALRVDRSLGLSELEPLGDDGTGPERAWWRVDAMPGAAPEGEPETGDRLARLVGARDILAAIATLDPSFVSMGA